MNTKLKTIMATTLLSASFTVASAGSDLLDIKNMKIFKELRQSIEFGKDLHKNYCRNGAAAFFQEVDIAMDDMQYVDTVECQITPLTSVYLLGIAAADAEIAVGGKVGVITITMETLTGSEYSGEAFHILPLSGDDAVSVVAAAVGTTATKGEVGSIVNDEDVFISGYCIASDTTTDTHGVISLGAELLGDVLLSDVLGIEPCTADND
jgi:hypothetical protein